MGEAMMNKANMVAMFKTAKAVVTDVLTAPVNSAVAIYKDCRAEKRSQLLSVWAPVAVQSHFALPGVAGYMATGSVTTAAVAAVVSNLAMNSLTGILAPKALFPRTTARLAAAQKKPALAL